MNATQQTVSEQLLQANQLNSAELSRALAAISAHHVDYADIYCQRTAYESWHLEEGMVKSGSFHIDQGVGVRAVSGEKTAFAYADSLSPAVLRQAAEAVRTIGAAGQERQIRLDDSGSFSGSRTQPALYAADNPIIGLDSAAKVALLNRVEQLAKAADPSIVQVMAGLTCEHDLIYLARLDGRTAADIRPLVRLSITVVAKRGERREMGSAGGGGRHGLDYFSEKRLREYVNAAVAQALVNLESRPAPAGSMTVVLGSGWPGVLLHEAVGHGLEGDFNRKGTSAFAGRLGERVAAEGVTVVDQGNIALRRGSLNLDDEGNETRQTVLIENGILTGYLQDETNARLMGMPLTGNGRRESYAAVPMPRMTNTFMQNGSREPEEIIASIDKGLYAVNFGGGQVDITSGKFVFSASEAWWVEGGKLQYPVKGATIIGSGPEVLKHVSMIGNDMALDSGIGVCGKEGQSVPVGVGQPTLRIDAGLTVGGSEAG
ncbi:metalloprotease TldD [Eikenella sp. S3360]|uniref:Metalloprotease TldD n=1 Tax=Eikenella glucosivorans TaxID=2766967 RepID=A0ABS0NBV0_9NEIS|nr:metalloprotease TldD [Eikenella glucosivorans]MBH5329740.1 metalloprotease TldD [Eikenella glucosivorans]